MRNMQIIGLFLALSVLSAPFVACAQQGVVKKSESAVKDDTAAKSGSAWKGVKNWCLSLSPETKTALAIAGLFPVFWLARELNYRAFSFLNSYAIQRGAREGGIAFWMVDLIRDQELVGAVMMIPYIAAMIPFIWSEPSPKP